MDKMKAKQRMETLISIIYNLGDQDECSMKHVGHGTSMMMKGVDPSEQDNYLDYKDAGFSHTLSDCEEDILVESGFQKFLWQEVYKLYKDHGSELLEDIPILYIGSYIEDY
ncbi:hypothetical protein [Vibrio phage vB_VibM_10AMN]|uniref:Uncharacterized protein n=1 Tax=Staphylococcus phage vB_VibM_10AMN12 TaxID=3076785 RepID=A0AA96KTH0_9CAUD|nr:hypothetical protein [Vibrio phage vB_VibM_10AMN]WNO47505.1 hypothetical protein [Staphylococcus phage vB_VibM_10AMN12]